MLDKKDSFSLIVGEDLIFHPQSANLAKLCGLIQKYTPFKIMVIPPQTNTLGVSLICTLADQAEGFVVGYNEKADFELSALGEGNMNIPALNQQEGTFTSCDKRIVPTNVALPYGGYVLNDFANVLLDDEVEFTIEYTSQLPTQKGFKAVEFDSLPNEFKNTQEENRGYVLELLSQESSDSFDKIEKFYGFAGTVIYKANPINQFNEFTYKAHQLAHDKTALYVSSSLMEKLNLNENDRVLVLAVAHQEELTVVLDEKITSDIAYVSFFDKNIETKKLFSTSRYSSATIKKV
jgi:NADH-quinone oxidoreductase subunit G